MCQPVGHRTDDHPLDQPGSAPADYQEVGLFPLADHHDGRGGIAQFLDGRVVDVVEVDGAFYCGQDLPLAGNQCLRQRCRSRGLTGDSLPPLGRPDHRQEDQAGMMDPCHGGRERSGPVALLGPVDGDDDH